MKRFISLLILALAFATSGYSQNESSALLWKISGKNLATPSYLFGTMHIIPTKDFLFTDTLRSKLKSSDVLVMEVANVTTPPKDLLQYFRLDSGTVWRYFTKLQLDSLFTFVSDSLHLNKEKMDLIFGKKDLFLLSQFLINRKYRKAIKDFSSYERSFAQITKANNIPIKGLETIQEQANLLKSIDPQREVKTIMKAIRPGKKNVIQKKRQLIQIYLSQDIQKIHELIASFKTEAQFEKTFIITRNKNWIQPIEEIIHKQRAFIAVGAGHLGGKKGVVSLLKKEGYTLTPIKL